MNANKDAGIETAPQSKHKPLLEDGYGSPFMPLYRTTTYRFPNIKALIESNECSGRGFVYTRYGQNPTINDLEQRLARTEKAECALAFGSGMAAISSTILAHGRRGIIVVGNIYGGTFEFMKTQCPELGIPVRFLKSTERDLLKSCLAEPNMLVYCETPANPTLDILDIAEIARIAHQQCASLVVDNTFATPHNQNPLLLGADLVVHSATKFLGGHSDITAGVVMGSEAYIDPILIWRKNLGQIISPDVAALLARSLQTLDIRMQRHNQTAELIATTMEKDRRIERVLYPGLRSFYGYAVAKTQMKGFGGMLTLVLNSDLDGAMRVADNLKTFILAASLGGTESLVSLPCLTSHFGMSMNEREQQGVSDNMLRLSVGLEDAADLIGDLQLALSFV